MRTKYYNRRCICRKIRDFIEGVVFVSIMFILLPGFAGKIESEYSRMGIVYSVDGDEITVEDSDGNLWAFDGDGYAKGETVKIILFDNHTTEKWDDELVKIKKVVDK